MGQGCIVRCRGHDVLRGEALPAPLGPATGTAPRNLTAQFTTATHDRMEHALGHYHHNCANSIQRCRRPPAADTTGPTTALRSASSYVQVGSSEFMYYADKRSYADASAVCSAYGGALASFSG